jgi:hypothetical protein
MYFLLLMRQLLNKMPFEQAISTFNLEISTSPPMPKKDFKTGGNGNISKVWLNETRVSLMVFSEQIKIKIKAKAFKLCSRLLLLLEGGHSPKC